MIEFEKDIFLDKDLAAAQLRRFAENGIFDQIKAKAKALREDECAAEMFRRKLGSLKAYYLECEKHPGFLGGQPFLIEKTIIYLRLLSQFMVNGFNELRMTLGEIEKVAKATLEFRKRDYESIRQSRESWSKKGVYVSRQSAGYAKFRKPPVSNASMNISVMP